MLLICKKLASCIAAGDLELTSEISLVKYLVEKVNIGYSEASDDLKMIAQQVERHYLQAIKELAQQRKERLRLFNKRERVLCLVAGTVAVETVLRETYTSTWSTVKPGQRSRNPYVYAMH